MENFVFLAVLFAALCHAGWNALIKVGLDPLSTTTLILAGATVFALAAVPFVPLPAAVSWPYLVASSFIHLFYFAGLAEAYRTGDLGQVYPIARGAAPLMTAVAGTIVLGEHLGVLAWCGILALAFGVLLLSLRGGRDLTKLDRRAVGFALFTAVHASAFIRWYGRQSARGSRATQSLTCSGGSSASAFALSLTRYGATGARCSPIWGIFGGAASRAEHSRSCPMASRYGR